MLLSNNLTKEDRMLRKVIIPSKDNSTVSIPAEFFGMEVEVLVFPFNGKKINQNYTINDIFARHLYTFDNYKFNRNEANNYE